MSHPHVKFWGGDVSPSTPPVNKLMPLGEKVSHKGDKWKVRGRNEGKLCQMVGATNTME